MSDAEHIERLYFYSTITDHVRLPKGEYLSMSSSDGAPRWLRYSGDGHLPLSTAYTTAEARQLIARTVIAMKPQQVLVCYKRPKKASHMVHLVIFLPDEQDLDNWADGDAPGWFFWECKTLNRYQRLLGDDLV